MLADYIAYPQSQDVPISGWSHGRLPFSENGTWDEFAKFWEDLPVDAYVTSEHRTSRYRRLGRVLARGGTDDSVVEVVPGASFFQSHTVNSVYGGVSRVFAPVTPEFYESAQVRDIIARDLGMIREIEGGEPHWLITFHLIRIIAAGDTTSAPAPEGRHQDGHDYVVMHLVSRQDCDGGQSRLFRSDEDEPVLVHTLTNRMETLVLDDRTMQHEVSPILPDGGPSAIRDMLIIDFDRIDDVGAIVTEAGISLAEVL
jgi:hypothetical protein